MLFCRSLLFAAPLSFISFTSAYIVTTEKWEPDAPLAPGKTLFYNVVVEAADTAVLVDIILANGIFGNTSDIFGDSDLRKKDDANAGFTVPVVPPGKQYTVRLVETSTKRFLADSPQFEIFGVNGVTASSPASSLPPTTLPPISATTTGSSPSSVSSAPPTTVPAISNTNTASKSSPSGSSSTINTGPPTSLSSGSPSPSASDTVPVKTVDEPKSKTSVGAIAGGVVGGLVVIGLVIFLLLWRRRRGTPTTQGTDNEKAPDLASPGPHAVEPYTLPPSSVRPGAGLDSTASLTGTDGRSTGAGPLPSKLAYGFAGTASSRHAGSSSQGDSILTSGATSAAGPSTALTRVDQLRLERERINRELASLEQRPAPGSNTTGSSGYGASSYMPPSSAGSRSNQESLAEQLAVLQTQIRQLEERQQHRESDLPPMYDGPPALAAGQAVAAAPPLSQYPVDTKR